MRTSEYRLPNGDIVRLSSLGNKFEFDISEPHDNFDYIIFEDSGKYWVKEGSSGKVISGNTSFSDLIQKYVGNSRILLASDVEADKTITLSSNTLIDLGGHKITWKQPHDLFRVPVGSNASFIEIRNGEIDSSGSGGTALSVYDSSYITVQNLNIHDVNLDTGGYGLYFYDSSNIRVDNVRLINIASRDALQFKGVTNAWVSNLYIENAKLYGIDMHNSDTPNYCRNINISNVTIENSGYGIDIQDYYINVENVVINNANTYALDIRGTGTIANLSNILIIGGTIGINMYYASSIAHLTANNIFIKSTSQHGIYVNACDTCSLNNITVLNAGQKGIYINSNNTKISNAYIANAAEAGIFINGKLYTIITNSDILNNNGYGITEYGSTDYSIIKNNRIAGNTSGGVLVSGVNSIIADNITV